MSGGSVVDRIAAVLARAQAFGGRESLNENNLAEMVAEALGLREEVSVRVGRLVGCVMSRPEADANPAVAEIVATRWLTPWVPSQGGTEWTDEKP